MRLVLVGLDGASPDLLADPFISDLPNLRRVLNEGCSGSLTSVYPYVTAPAWASILSGADPGKHGIFENFTLGARGVQPANLLNSKVPLLWNLLSNAGLKVVVAGIPFVSPAPKVNGIFVSGRFAPRLSTYPENMKDEARLDGFQYDGLKVHDDYVSMVEQILIHGSRAVSQRSVEAFRQRAAGILSILRRESWDVAVLIEGLPDEVLHLSYGDQEVLFEMYRELDNWIGDIMNLLDPKSDLLLLVSDHGFGNLNKLFYLVRWLSDSGLVSVRRSMLRSALEMLGLTPESIVNGGVMTELYRLLLRFFPNSTVRIRERFSKEFFADPLEAQSTVKAVGINEPTAWIEVNPHADPAIIDKIAHGLRSLEVDGFKVVKNVFRTNELYRGPCEMGELLVECCEGLAIDTRRMGKGSLLGIPHSTKKGCHRRDGIFLAWGGQCVHEGNLKLSACDVTPTILHFLSLPIPEYIDGDVIQLWTYSPTRPVK